MSAEMFGKKVFCSGSGVKCSKAKKRGNLSPKFPFLTWLADGPQPPRPPLFPDPVIIKAEIQIRLDLYWSSFSECQLLWTVGNYIIPDFNPAPIKGFNLRFLFFATFQLKFRFLPRFFQNPSKVNEQLSSIGPLPSNIHYIAVLFKVLDHISWSSFNVFPGSFQLFFCHKTTVLILTPISDGTLI